MPLIWSVMWAAIRPAWSGLLEESRKALQGGETVSVTSLGRALSCQTFCCQYKVDFHKSPWLETLCIRPVCSPWKDLSDAVSGTWVLGAVLLVNTQQSFRDPPVMKMDVQSHKTPPSSSPLPQSHFHLSSNNTQSKMTIIWRESQALLTQMVPYP